MHLGSGFFSGAGVAADGALGAGEGASAVAAGGGVVGAGATLDAAGGGAVGAVGAGACDPPQAPSRSTEMVAPRIEWTLPLVPIIFMVVPNLEVDGANVQHKGRGLRSYENHSGLSESVWLSTRAIGAL
jgi:hypothetical protein